MMRKREDGGMAPTWLRLEIVGDELIVEEKSTSDRRATIRYALISNTEQARLYKVFRENKFDLLENYQPADITYDAGSSSLSIRAGKDLYGASSGANSPLRGNGEIRFSAILTAFGKLLQSKRSELKVFPDNTSVLDFSGQEHPPLPKNSRRADLTYEEAAKIIVLVKSALEAAGNNGIADESSLKLQLLPYSADDARRVYVNGFCDEFPQNFDRRLFDADGSAKCRFSLFVGPRDGSYRKLIIDNQSQAHSSRSTDNS